MVLMPGWRNWQTRRTQNPVLAREWEFDPPSGHHLNNDDQPREKMFGRDGGQAFRPHAPYDGWVAVKPLDMMGSLPYSARVFA